MGRIPLTGLDRLNYCSRRLTRRAKGGSQRQWGCARLRTGLRKAITHKESPLSRDAFLGRCIRAGILYLAFAIYQMPGAAAHAAPFAYVTNAGEGSVSVIDIATNTVLTTVTVGVSPEQVAVSPNGHVAYVTDPGSDTVWVIATASNTVVATVALPVGSGPAGVAITLNGLLAYVANFGSNTVSVIDTATNTVTATISVGVSPTGIATTPPNTPSIPTLSNGAFLFLLAAMAAALALRIVTRQASPPPRPPRAI